MKNESESKTSVVLNVTTDTRIFRQQVSSPTAAPTAGSSSATGTPAATPQPTTAASTASPAVTSPTTATTPAATAISSSAAAAAPHAADTSSTVPSAGTVANSSTAANATSTAAGRTVTPVSTLRTQLEAPWDLDILDQASLPLDSKYEYTNDGTGVNIYMLDTVSIQASLKQQASVPYARAAHMHQSCNTCCAQ